MLPWYCFERGGSHKRKHRQGLSQGRYRKWMSGCENPSRQPQREPSPCSSPRKTPQGCNGGVLPSDRRPWCDTPPPTSYTQATHSRRRPTPRPP